MFEGWTQWTWVIVAWAQLLLAYGGYLAYLAWRRRKLPTERAQQANGRARGGEG